MTLQNETAMDAVVALMTELVGREDTLGCIALEHLATGGKRLRARLALAALEALGQPRHNGVGWAAACELLHNGTLVHDDLQDGDSMRRGQPAVWVQHGAAQAINTGDLLLLLPFVALRAVSCEAEDKWRLSERLAQCTVDVIRGQAAELELPQKPTWQNYEQAVRGKTSALFTLPVWGAALIAQRSAEEAALLAGGFAPLGVLFQMQDDVLDLYGDKGRAQRGSDLYEGKVSCLVVEHLRLHPHDSDFVMQVLAQAREQTRMEDVQTLLGRFEEGGALRAVVTRIRAGVLSVENDAGLRQEPSLHSLACELAATALKPITHVLQSFT